MRCPAIENIKLIKCTDGRLLVISPILHQPPPFIQQLRLADPLSSHYECSSISSAHAHHCATHPSQTAAEMPRRRPDRQYANTTALSFYNAKLRGNPGLRRSCSDRHILDDAIDRWKEGQRLDGMPIRGVSRSDIIFSLKSRWKLIESKVTEENIIIWKEDVVDEDEDGVGVVASDAHQKASRIARTVERIRNSRMELESNRNGIVIDNAQFEDDICKIGQRVTWQISIRNESYSDLLCTVKGGAAKQRGIIIDGEPDIYLTAGYTSSINVSFLPKMMGITKSIVVFDFSPIDIDEDDSIDAFSIARYISIRAGDPADFALLKPTTPYVKKRQDYDDRGKFSNPVRAQSRVTTRFVNLLGRYPIPDELELLIAYKKDAMRKIDKMYRGEGNYFEESDKIDYSSHLTVDNYTKCMQHLLWVEEAQMNGKFSCYSMVNLGTLFSRAIINS